MIYSAQDIANYFIAVFAKRREEITNLKLQKLLYYAQAWHLALYDTPLFRERIEAWIHGPVIPTVFRHFRQYGWQPIPVQKISDPLSEHSQAHLNEVLRVYGKLDGPALERLTHREAPWRDARKGLTPDEPSNRIITHEAMKRYYGARVHG
ncbi:MAG: DUF4065 domain-containing protein [Acidobacterium ailaaui]|nr:DUF4065 domain-containing protein [Pseudacidobacterium ailaaui]